MHARYKKKEELSRQQANRVMGDDWGSYEI